MTATVDVVPGGAAGGQILAGDTRELGLRVLAANASMSAAPSVTGCFTRDQCDARLASYRTRLRVDSPMKSTNLQLRLWPHATEAHTASASLRSER
jgi:hypothetical protein